MDRPEVRLESEHDVSRRSFLQRAGLTGLAAAWASPIIQTVAAGDAFANGGGPHAAMGTPQPGSTPSVQTPISSDDVRSVQSESNDSKDKKSKDSKDSGGRSGDSNDSEVRGRRPHR